MPSPGWNVTAADVSRLAGGVSFLASALENAIEKHDECAAAISSSGLVRPSASFARDAQVTSNVPRPEDSSVTCPFPSRREPSQCVVALRVVAIVSIQSGYGAVRPARYENPAQTQTRRP